MASSRATIKMVLLIIGCQCSCEYKHKSSPIYLEIVSDMAERGDIGERNAIQPTSKKRYRV